MCVLLILKRIRNLVVRQALKRGFIFNDFNGTNKFVPFPNLAWRINNYFAVNKD